LWRFLASVFAVIASEAKQSSVKKEVWIASSHALLAMTLTDVVDD
jgi:hypothetical protein